jgi:hypothetical protein
MRFSACESSLPDLPRVLGRSLPREEHALTVERDCRIGRRCEERNQGMPPFRIAQEDRRAGFEAIGAAHPCQRLVMSCHRV